MIFYSPCVVLLLFCWTAAGQQDNLSAVLQSLYGNQAPNPNAQTARLPQGGNYIWGEWGAFGACSVTCGRGIRRRQRSCYMYQQSQQANPRESSSSLASILPLALLGGGNAGNDMSSLLTIMAMSGNRGLTSRQGAVPSTYQQQLPQFGCVGEAIGSMVCIQSPCPRNVFTTTPITTVIAPPTTTNSPRICLTDWGAWGQCSASCGRAIRLRIRQCTCRNPITGDSSCQEQMTNSEICVKLPPCSTSPPPTLSIVLPTAVRTVRPSPASPSISTEPIPTRPSTASFQGSSASWGIWEPWTGCTMECGKLEIESRTRECIGVGSCVGQFREVRRCSFVACSTAPPSWSQWGPFSMCTATCGTGQRIRERTCSVAGACAGSALTNEPCNVQPCPTPPPPPTWLTWGSYSSCSTSCGFGQRTRQRSCSVPGACNGRSFESRDCGNRPCPTLPPLPSWSRWTPYGDCSTSCGMGVRSRQRVCSVLGSCPGNPTESTVCENQPACPTLLPRPTWSQWGPIGACSTTCGAGERTRSRTCSVAGLCQGVSRETLPCINQPCPTLPPPPTWSQWGPYGDCSRTCGVGERSRTRTCPHAGLCPGISRETMSCSDGPCPTLPPPPTWNQWGPYGTCTRTCGGGQRHRLRACPVDGMCPGIARETVLCANQICPTLPPPPTWGQWGPFGACSRTCGGGRRYRLRTCSINGLCQGMPRETVICASEQCPTLPPPPVWLQWTSYSDCSTTCGFGLRIRRRVCSSPLGLCQGNITESVECVNQPCRALPPPPVWSTWTAYSSCPVSCGSGLRTRRRFCSVRGACSGNTTESVECSNQPCETSPPLPTWTQWGPYGACSRTCGTAERSRVRVCPVEGLCPGAARENLPCNNQPCPTIASETTWGGWGPFSLCTTTCGPGLRIRLRTCPVSGSCPGSASENSACSNRPCPVIPSGAAAGNWNPWGQYMPCSTTCGEGEKIRYRTCRVAAGCEGDSIENVPCTNGPCENEQTPPQWNNWGPYGPCMQTCGPGERTRVRTCPDTGLCQGSAIDFASCPEQRPCPLVCDFSTPEERRDCGHPGISRTNCRERGCCYDDASRDTIWCFHPASTSSQMEGESSQTEASNSVDRA